MNVNDIAFPNLNIYLENVPKTITVFGGFSIAYYGIIIGAAMLLCVLTAAYDRKSRGAGSGGYLGLRDLRHNLRSDRSEALLCDLFLGHV